MRRNPLSRMNRRWRGCFCKTSHATFWQSPQKEPWQKGLQRVYRIFLWMRISWKAIDGSLAEPFTLEPVEAVSSFVRKKERGLRHKSSDRSLTIEKCFWNQPFLFWGQQGEDIQKFTANTWSNGGLFAPYVQEAEISAAAEESVGCTKEDAAAFYEDMQRRGLRQRCIADKLRNISSISQGMRNGMFSSNKSTMNFWKGILRHRKLRMPFSPQYPLSKMQVNGISSLVHQYW